MTDRYLQDQHCIDRLLNEWEKYGSIIVAYEFDDVVYDYHGKSDKHDNVIALLRKAKKLGCHLAVFSCSESSRVPFIQKYLTDNDIPFDTINEMPSFLNFDCRKIYYNHLLDSRSSLSAAYAILNEVCEIVYLNRNADQIKSKQDIDF